jgi:hypothetical protein
MQRPGDTLISQTDKYVDDINSPKFYVVRGGKKKLLENSEFYAIYNGKFWYKSTPFGTYFMKKENNDFYFKARFRSVINPDNNDAAAIVGMLGGPFLGAVGGAIVATAVQASSVNVDGQNVPTGMGIYKYKINHRDGLSSAVRRLK